MMKTALATMTLSCAFGAAFAAGQAQVQAQVNVTVTRAGSQPSSAGPAQNFTGAVRVDSPFQASAPGRVSGGIVTFEPGARTAWHVHPLGQTLIVTAGFGRVQQWGGAQQEIRPGDVVWIPPGAKHWHGATPSTGMSHVAITESLDGKSTDWMEKVSDAQYQP
ncbi:cupin domain-containing protein [Pseudoduganella sp. SL102]|uniref:(R)-mandelonitrile lyase n=1 Tax=Pseudoduganella sp. SL102 TaxID=2995154 RepID=UPI0035A2C9C1